MHYMFSAKFARWFLSTTIYFDSYKQCLIKIQIFLLLEVDYSYEYTSYYKEAHEAIFTHPPILWEI